MNSCGNRLVSWGTSSSASGSVVTLEMAASSCGPLPSQPRIKCDRCIAGVTGERLSIIGGGDEQPCQHTRSS